MGNECGGIIGDRSYGILEAFNLNNRTKALTQSEMESDE